MDALAQNVLSKEEDKGEEQLNIAQEAAEASKVSGKSVGEEQEEPKRRASVSSEEEKQRTRRRSLEALSLPTSDSLSAPKEALYRALHPEGFSKKQEREKSHQYHTSQQLYEGRAPTKKQAKEPTCRFGHKGTGSESHTYSSSKG